LPAALLGVEQAKGKAVDKRADIWVFGCILFECLTGKHAFEGDTISETLASILKGEPDWGALPAGLPANVGAVVQRCLRKDPRDRMRDIGDVRFALEMRPYDLTAIGVDQAGMRPQSLRRVRILRWVVAAMSIVAALAAIGVFVIRAQLAEPGKISLSIRLPDRWEVVGAPAISPGGDLVAYSARDETGESAIYLRALDRFEVRRIDAPEQASGPFFSPDGRHVAFFAGNGLYRASVVEGGAKLITRIKALFGGSWGEDGTIVYSEGVGSPIWSVPASGGKPTSLTTINGSEGSYAHVWPQHIAGGAYLVFKTWGRQPSLRLFDVRTGQHRPLLGQNSGSVSWAPPALLLIHDAGLGVRVLPFDPDRQMSPVEAVPVVESVYWSLNGDRSYFSASPTGTLVYVPGNPLRQRLVWVSREGSAEIVLDEDAPYGRVALSPDSTSALVGGAGDIWQIDLRRRVRTRATFGEGDNHGPVWSADGRRIYFSSNRQGQWAVWAVDAAGSRPPELALKREHSVYVTAVGSAGELLFREVHPQTGNDLWLRNAQGKDIPIRVTPFSEGGAADLSPDGRWIAYASNENGRTEVYVIAATGTGAPVRASAEGGNFPQWARSGRALYFQRGRRLMRVAVDGGQPAGAAQPVFGRDDLERGGFSVEADEQRLLAVQAEPDGIPNEIRIVTGFLASVQQRLDSAKKR